jgi:hypothetical protein
MIDGGPAHSTAAFVPLAPLLRAVSYEKLDSARRRMARLHLDDLIQRHRAAFASSKPASATASRVLWFLLSEELTRRQVAPWMRHHHSPCLRTWVRVLRPPIESAAKSARMTQVCNQAPQSLEDNISTRPRSHGMRFNIYGRFQVEVRRENESWTVYRAEMGKRAELNDVVIPPDLEANDIAGYLDDIFHEFAGIGQRVELMQE